MKNRITEIRRAKGLSLAAVAIAVGTTKSQIKKLEDGDRRLTLDWMHPISKALGVSLTDLIPSSALKRGNNRVDDNISSLVALLSDADKETMLNLAKVLFEKNALIFNQLSAVRRQSVEILSPGPGVSVDRSPQ